MNKFSFVTASFFLNKSMLLNDLFTKQVQVGLTWQIVTFTLSYLWLTISGRIFRPEKSI